MDDEARKDNEVYDRLAAFVPRSLVRRLIVSEEDRSSPVSNIRDFRRKYGTQGPGLIVAAFVSAAPRFPGDVKLAALLGELTGDLEVALQYLDEEV